MQTMVVYNSATGFTEKYADWISEGLGCAKVTYEEYLRHPCECDLLIYGSSLLAGKIKGLDKVKTNRKNKEMMVFATGASPQKMEKTLVEGMMEANFSDIEKNSILVYYFVGGINYEKMKFPTRKMLQIMGKMLHKKADKTEEEAEMGKALAAGSFDHADKGYILPLIEQVKEMEKRF